MSDTEQAPNRPRMFRLRRVCWALVVAAAYLWLPSSALGQTEGEHLYNVTMLRAAPGHFTELISTLEESIAVGDEAGDEAPFWIRHSQGDQWDFMLIYPMGDFSSYYDPGRVERRASAWGTSRGIEVSERLSALTSYREEWFARSVDPDEMERRFDGMGLFHVEMFAGLPGKRAELLEQRRMENRYYVHLDRPQNLLFVREVGSSWDAMTIGFHESLAAFAEGGSLHSEAEQDEAARVAGFDGGDRIGSYLRSLLDYHNDTLAVPVR
jgi:hypothetical protein